MINSLNFLIQMHLSSFWSEDVIKKKKTKKLFLVPDIKEGRVNSVSAGDVPWASSPHAPVGLICPAFLPLWGTLQLQTSFDVGQRSAQMAVCESHACQGPLFTMWCLASDEVSTFVLNSICVNFAPLGMSPAACLGFFQPSEWLLVIYIGIWSL